MGVPFVYQAVNKGDHIAANNINILKIELDGTQNCREMLDIKGLGGLPYFSFALTLR